MISIREIASALHPAQKGRRFLAIYRFFCDESYDSDPNVDGAVPRSSGDRHVPASYVVAGFFAEEAVWSEIEGLWSKENQRVGVKRYHAADVNGFHGEFQKFSKDEQIKYSVNLLRILRDQRQKLNAIACGLMVRDYEDVISPHGREAFGHPYTACFKTVVAMIAQWMDAGEFRPDDKFAVIFDNNRAPHTLHDGCAPLYYDSCMRFVYLLVQGHAGPFRTVSHQIWKFAETGGGLKLARPCGRRPLLRIQAGGKNPCYSH